MGLKGSQYTYKKQKVQVFKPAEENLIYLIKNRKGEWAGGRKQKESALKGRYEKSGQNLMIVITISVTGLSIIKRNSQTRWKNKIQK